MPTTIIYIHGANATSNSFNYIRSQVDTDGYVIDYNSSCGFRNNLRDMIKTVKQFQRVTLVGHSLGGIYALYLSNLLPSTIIQGITLSTPYGGSEPADVFRWLQPAYRLWHDIASNGAVMREARAMPLHHPWCNVVSTRGGNPWFAKPNDSVVSLSSMRAKPGMELIDQDVNHYEVVMKPETVSLIQRRISLYG